MQVHPRCSRDGRTTKPCRFIHGAAGTAAPQNHAGSSAVQPGRPHHKTMQVHPRCSRDGRTTRPCRFIRCATRTAAPQDRSGSSAVQPGRPHRNTHGQISCGADDSSIAISWRQALKDLPPAIHGIGVFLKTVDGPFRVRRKRDDRWRFGAPGWPRGTESPGQKREAGRGIKVDGDPSEAEGRPLHADCSCAIRRRWGRYQRRFEPCIGRVLLLLPGRVPLHGRLLPSRTTRPGRR